MHPEASNKAPDNKYPDQWYYQKQTPAQQQGLPGGSFFVEGFKKYYYKNIKEKC